MYWPGKAQLPNSSTTQIYLKMQFDPTACVRFIEYFDLSLLII